MWIAVGVCAVLVLVGLVVLWPGGTTVAATDPSGLDGDPVKATVESVDEVPCSFDPLLACKQVEIVVADGEFDGAIVLEQPLDSTISAGDGILVDLVDLGGGGQPGRVLRLPTRHADAAAWSSCSWPRSWCWVVGGASARSPAWR